jgi:hypothetical protein
MKVIIRRARAILAITALGGALAALPSAALADSGGEGCMGAKAGSACTDTNGALVYSDSRTGSFTSASGYFQYKGFGPFTISYSGGSISCPKATWCERFFPEILVPVDSTVIVTTSGGGSLFAGALPAAGGD